MVPEASMVTIWRGPTPTVAPCEASSFGTSEMERSRMMKAIQGTWMNMDCPGERYVVVGQHVTRNDLQGCRHFSLHWDPGRKQLQWGTQGRLYLACLGEGLVAWVPMRNSSRAWRWQRVAAPTMAMSPQVLPSWSVPWGRHEGPQMSAHLLVRADSFSYSYSPWRRPYTMRSWGYGGPSRDFSVRRNYGYGRSNVGRNSGFQDRDSRLACGLSSAEVFDLLFRDITPEDYETLLRLDESVSRPTASASSIDRLEKVSGKELLGESCSVCLVVFEEADVAAVLPCRHHFHSTCISKWLAECRSSCPLCGEKMDTKSTEASMTERSEGETWDPVPSSSSSAANL